MPRCLFTHTISPVTPKRRRSPSGTPKRRTPSTPTSSPRTPVIVMGDTSGVSPETIKELSNWDCYPRVNFAFNAKRYVNEDMQDDLQSFWEDIKRQCEAE